MIFSILHAQNIAPLRWTDMLYADYITRFLAHNGARAVIQHLIAAVWGPIAMSQKSIHAGSHRTYVSQILATLLISLSFMICVADTPAALAQPAADQVTSHLIEGVKQVAPDLYRGAYPDASVLTALKNAGVTTIVCLCNEKKLVARESSEASQMGLKLVCIPLSPFHRPADSDIKQFLNITKQKAQNPVYVHCRHGEDRTGAMVGLYRVMENGWSADAAYREMLSDGFHPFFFNLSRAVFEYAQAQGHTAHNVPATRSS
jgi:tyrosine-protein phosphatase SIW14